MDKINLPGQQKPMDKVTHHILSRSKMMEISFLRAGTVKLYGWQEENNSGQILLRFSNSGANKLTNHLNKCINHLKLMILCTINRSLVKTNHFFLKMVLFTLKYRYFI